MVETGDRAGVTLASVAVTRRAGFGTEYASGRAPVAPTPRLVEEVVVPNWVVPTPGVETCGVVLSPPMRYMCPPRTTAVAAIKGSAMWPAIDTLCRAGSTT